MDELQREGRDLTTADIAAARTEGRREAPEAASTGGNAPGTAIQVDREREADQPSALFSPEQTDGLRKRWDEVQTAFVDEPRAAVERADGLVAETIKRLAEIFAAERQNLEGQWDRGTDVSTEDLRQALRRYRSFFDRLLAV
jgi:hypothetical protein